MRWDELPFIMAVPFGRKGHNSCHIPQFQRPDPIMTSVRILKNHLG